MKPKNMGHFAMLIFFGGKKEVFCWIYFPCKMIGFVTLCFLGLVLWIHFFCLNFLFWLICNLLIHLVVFFPHIFFSELKDCMGQRCCVDL